jgi:hypothetical protein
MSDLADRKLGVEDVAALQCAAKRPYAVPCDVMASAEASAGTKRVCSAEWP